MADQKPVSRPWMWFLLPVVFFANTEAVVAPLAIYTGMASSYWMLNLIVGTIGFLGMIFWYFFVDQIKLGFLHLSFVQWTIREGEFVFYYLKDLGVIKFIVGHIQKDLTRFQQDHTDPRFIFNSILRVGKVFRLPMFFMSTALPIPFFSSGLWAPALTYCRLTNWYTGFLVMILGDLFKNMFFYARWWWTHQDQVAAAVQKLWHLLPWVN